MAIADATTRRTESAAVGRSAHTPNGMTRTSSTAHASHVAYSQRTPRKLRFKRTVSASTKVNFSDLGLRFWTHYGQSTHEVLLANEHSYDTIQQVSKCVGQSPHAPSVALK